MVGEHRGTHSVSGGAVHRSPGGEPVLGPRSYDGPPSLWLCVNDVSSCWEIGDRSLLQSPLASLLGLFDRCIRAVFVCIFTEVSFSIIRVKESFCLIEVARRERSHTTQKLKYSLNNYLKKWHRVIERKHPRKECRRVEIVDPNPIEP